MERFETPSSKLAVFRNNHDIYMTITRSGTPELEREQLIKLSLMVDNKEIKNHGWELSHDTLKLISPAGTVEFKFEGDDCLKVWGKGRVCLRFNIHGLRQFENGCPREDGSFEVVFWVLGKLLFVPLRGVLWQNAKWIPAKAQSDDFEIDLLPSVETGVFEASVYEYFSNKQIK